MNVRACFRHVFMAWVAGCLAAALATGAERRQQLEESFLAALARVDEPVQELDSAWDQIGLPAPEAGGSQWFAGPSSGEWHVWGLILAPEMILPLGR